MKCSQIKANGSACRASAVHSDPEGRCVFHSSLSFPGQHRSSELTKVEAIRTVTQAIRALRKTKRDPVERADALRNLIVLWQTLTAPEVEAPAKALTSAERIAMLEKAKQSQEKTPKA